MKNTVWPFLFLRFYRNEFNSDIIEFHQIRNTPWTAYR